MLANIPIFLSALIFLAGCHGTGWRAAESPTNTPAGTPRVGDLLESFSFPALSGESLAWSESSGTLKVGPLAQHPEALFLHVFQPDCPKCQALARALEDFAKNEQKGKLAAVAVTHRGDELAANDFVDSTRASYSIAIGTGSAWAHKWGRGDPLYIVDRTGKVVYSQVGFEVGDPQIWRMVLADLQANRTVRMMHPSREGLHTGDPLPTLRLADLFANREISLSSDRVGLIFSDAKGLKHRYRASIGFFSRY